MLRCASIKFGPTFAICLGLLLPSAVLAQSEPRAYLPLELGTKWVLRNVHQRTPVVFEVTRSEENGFVLQSTTPWGSSRWTLSDDSGKYVMTAYGNGSSGPMMPVKARPVYIDFSRGPDEKWKNSLGTLTVLSRSVSVHTAKQTYENCIQIEHVVNKTRLVSTFAQAVGYVQFGDGDAAFVLDEAASTLPGRPRGLISRENKVQPESIRTRTQSAARVDSRRVRIGITPNQFAGEPVTEAVMQKRLQQTVDAGVTYISGTAKWADLEPTEGQYDLGSVITFLSAASEHNLPVSYTLRVIDTIARDVPGDLRKVKWSDPRMINRVLRLIDTLAPLLKDQVRWLSIGYEVDSYLAKRPSEALEFAKLHALSKLV